MLTIFANVMINNQNRLQHMKDSFLSFKDISDNWLLNIRGKLREEAMDFFKKQLGDKLVLFELLDEERGWFQNSIDMIQEAKYDYVLMWNEDHLNMAPLDLYEKIICEMKKENMDYLMYSWWINGGGRWPFEVKELKKGENIDTLRLTKKIWRQQLALGRYRYKGFEHCLITLQGIFKKDFCLGLLAKELGRWPRFITTYLFFGMMVLDKIGIKFHHRKFFDCVNRFLGGHLTKAKYGPFDFEKTAWRFDILPFKMAIPKQELFACIDDDVSIDGYQLIKRGLYPTNFELKKDGGESLEFNWGTQELLEKNDFYTVYKIHLNNAQKYCKIRYQNQGRINEMPRETIVNIGDILKLKVGDKNVVVKNNDSISIYPNLNHEITATSDNCRFFLIVPTALDY